jgi:protocatechuate 3,4-dioxygenase alpha subunit
MPRETPSQTAGPYVHIGLVPEVAGIPGRGNEAPQVLAGPTARGIRIRLEGVVLDGTGTAVRDAVIELWQADAEGRFAHPEDPRAAEADPAVRGFGRAAADLATGEWWFETVKPGRVPFPDGRLQAPHLLLAIFARGINIHLVTRVYFEDEADANARDPVLAMIEQEARRRTLLARRVERGALPTYRFEIRLQGEGETVFLDV